MNKPETTTNVHFEMIANPLKMNPNIKIPSPKIDKPEDIQISVSATSTKNSPYGTPAPRSTRHSPTRSTKRSSKKHNTTDTTSSESDAPPVHDDRYSTLNEAQKRLERLKVLDELNQLQRYYGVQLSKEYSPNSDYYEMINERDYHLNHKKKIDSVELAKGALVLMIKATEFYNNKYDPFSLELNGWSHAFEAEKANYTEVLCELYDKYVSTGKSLPPELKLVFMICMSATTYHATQVMLKKVDVSGLMKNPNIARNVQQQMQQQQQMPQQQQQMPQQQYQQMPPQPQFQQQQPVQIRMSPINQSILKDIKKQNETVTVGSDSQSATSTTRKRRTKMKINI